MDIKVRPLSEIRQEQMDTLVQQSVAHQEMINKIIDEVSQDVDAGNPIPFLPVVSQ